MPIQQFEQPKQSDQINTPEEIKPKTEGDKKIEEYASRILGGQNPAYVLDGLPESWVKKVNEIVNKHEPLALGDIPPQYRDISSEALDIIWADQSNIPFRTSQSEVDRSKEINRRKRIVALKKDNEEKSDKYDLPVNNQVESVVPKKQESTPLLSTEERRKLTGWSASYELAKVAKQQGVDLSKISREEYVEYAIQNSLAIDDDQLRVAPWQRAVTSVDEIVSENKKRKAKIEESSDKVFAKFCFDMQKKAEGDDRYLSENVRVRQGTKDSNSWLFFGINNGTTENSNETFKSYVSVKDLNTLTPERFKQFMVTLKEAGYNGDIKIFQDLAGQGIRLNDQIVMHGGSENDAKLALETAEKFFGNDIDQKSIGKDEVVDGVNKSYSQILAKKIAESISKQN
jgi:hypothetical protein